MSPTIKRKPIRWPTLASDWHKTHVKSTREILKEALLPLRQDEELDRQQVMMNASDHQILSRERTCIN